MAHFLIADGDEGLRRRLRQALEPAGNVADETADPAEVAGLVEHAKATHDPFDLLLIGSGLAKAVASLAPDACDHALVQLGDEPLPGALTAIPANATPEATLAAFNVALTRRERHLGRLSTWTRALAFLDGLAQDPAAGGLQVAAQRAAIADAYARVPAVLAQAGSGEAGSALALADLAGEATKALCALGVPLTAFLGRMGAYQATPSFWIALRQAFATDRIWAYALIAELERLQRDKLAHGRANPAGHFVLPLFGTHRLFFRWSNGVRVLEDVATSERETAVLERLAHAPEAPVPLATGQLV